MRMKLFDSGGAGASGQTTGVQCACAPGFTGATCEVDVNECEAPADTWAPGGVAETCLNGGTCVDRPGGFECACPPSWTDPLCQTPTLGAPALSSDTLYFDKYCTTVFLQI